MVSLQATKWIENLHPEGSVARAARRSLKLRLGAVRDLLKLACSSGANESEVIHQVRVAARRAAAAIELYADFLPAHRTEWIARRLKKLRKAAGPPRDLDVMSELFGKLSQEIDGASAILPVLSKEKQLARADFQVRHRKYRKQNRLKRRLNSLPKLVRDRREIEACDANPESFSNWSRTELRRVVQEFFDSAPERNADADALHRFRIQCKHLRYTIELIGSAFPAELQNDAYPHLVALQVRLGEINDLTMASLYLKRKLADANDTLPEQPLRTLRHACEIRLDAAREDFYAFWADEVREKLSSCLEEMLADREENCDSLR